MWRAKYGFIWSDEPYYFETAYRFLQGDKPIVDDWYTAQIYSVLLVPYMKLMRLILGNGFSGIFLISRYIYIFIQLFVSVFCYRIIANKSRIAALVSSIFFMFYCRGNIATISYYSVCTASLFLLLMLTYHYFDGKRDFFYQRKKPIKNILFWSIIGILWGIVIICNPYLIIQFCLYYLGVCIYCKIKNEKLGGIVFVIVGAVIVGSLFVYYIIKDIRISDIFTGISYVMTDDSYYGSRNIFFKIFSGVLYVGNRFRLTIIFSVLSVVALLFINYKRIHHKISSDIDRRYSIILFVLNLFVLMTDCIYPEHSVYTVGTCSAALAVFGFQVFLTMHNKDYKIFLFVFIPGWVAALLMSASSDTHYSATTQGLTIAAIATIIMTISLIHEFVNEVSNSKGILEIKFISIISLMACIVVLLVSAYDRIELVYRDKSINQLTMKIADGPAKGIMTTGECERRYIEIYNTVSRIEDADGNLYVMNFCPWAYLLTDMDCSPYTSWRIMPDVDDGLGQEYYETHPDKFPDIVLRLSYENTEYDENSTFDEGSYGDMSDGNSSLDYSWNHSKLIDELLNLDYRIVDVPCGIMYVNSSEKYDWINEKLFN